MNNDTALVPKMAKRLKELGISLGTAKMHPMWSNGVVILDYKKGKDHRFIEICLNEPKGLYFCKVYQISNDFRASFETKVFKSSKQLSGLFR